MINYSFEQTNNRSALTTIQSDITERFFLQLLYFAKIRSVKTLKSLHNFSFEEMSDNLIFNVVVSTNIFQNGGH